MVSTRSLRDSRVRAPSPIPAGERQWHQAVRRECDRATLAFRLGGILLGTAGCILGAWMPYSHPVARTLSVLWWGVFLGCLGGSVCAVAGLWAEPTRPSPAPGRWHLSTAHPAVRRGPSRFSEEHRRRF